MAGTSKLREAGAGRALITGGSMSGLLAALLLRRAGWDVAVFERVESELAGRGAGIVAQPDLIATLRRLGIDPTDLGVEITTRKILESSGRLAGEFACPQVLTAWERVYRVLRDAFPRERYHRGRGVRAFEQDERSVVVHFADGGTAEGELLVGADGLRSTIRQQCLPELAPLYAGYVAWRALIPEAAFAPAIHRELFNYMTFCLPPGEQCLGYPVAGPDNDLRPGHRRYNVVWYRPADESGELQHLLTDESGTTHTISIPPPLIRRDAIAQNARGGGALAGAAIPRGRAHDRRADPAADLRSRNAAHGLRPGRDHRRRCLRCATPCRGRGGQGGG